MDHSRGPYNSHHPFNQATAQGIPEEANSQLLPSSIAPRLDLHLGAIGQLGQAQPSFTASSIAYQVEENPGHEETPSSLDPADADANGEAVLDRIVDLQNSLTPASKGVAIGLTLWKSLRQYSFFRGVLKSRADKKRAASLNDRRWRAAQVEAQPKLAAHIRAQGIVPGDMVVLHNGRHTMGSFTIGRYQPDSEYSVLIGEYRAGNEVACNMVKLSPDTKLRIKFWQSGEFDRIEYGSITSVNRGSVKFVMKSGTVLTIQSSEIVEISML